MVLPGHPYVVESYGPGELAVLGRHVTNADRPVFALVDLPEVVKGALFARYSRSPKSLRRLLLDEFAEDLSGVGAGTGDGTVVADEEAASRAGRLYDRVFDQYGDDSVAQLGGAHIAVEQASNLLTKQLEWGRLAAYLEQSTRYMAYDDRPEGRWRYYRDPDVMGSPHADAYTTTLDAVFATYAELLPRLRDWSRERYPQDAGTSDAAYRRSVNAKACDVLRGLLPAATVSNVGIFASGQAYEQLLLRLRSSELTEARSIGDLMLAELRQVIPSFLTRVDRPERGGVWAEYLRATRQATRAVAEELLAGTVPEPAEEVTLVAWSPDAEVELLTGMLYPHSTLPEAQLTTVVEGLSAQDRQRVVAAYVGERSNRRHKPGRALERVSYRFDVCSDYGAFRDLQRHRMLTIQWQELSPRHGYDTPPEVVEAGAQAEWDQAMDRLASLWERLYPDYPRQAQYAVGFAWRLRYSMQLNARAAMQMLELRTSPQGHPSYRRICQRMHRLIAEEAGHTAVAAMMRHVDHSAGGLERLEAERAADARRAARA
ncbi:MAG: FAD-dependent thymidylate synthase [Euzebyales bacterium]|nr:FAD-dependent thymidylate synthase [Euzebyales bacterium]MBA3621817.1 FAD-dependent thymidylate synthase [Euzebyales bacterium]